MKTMLEVMKERLPEGLTVVKTKQRSGSNQIAIDFNYKGMQIVGWLQNTCSPGMVEKNCDFTITSVMISFALLMNDMPLAMEWKAKQDKVLGLAR